MELPSLYSRRILRGENRAIILALTIPKADPRLSVLEAIWQADSASVEMLAKDLLAQSPTKQTDPATAMRTEIGYRCRAELMGSRYLSLTKSLQIGQGRQKRRWEERTVWDLSTGLLCPLERFIPRAKARHYHRYFYRLSEEFAEVVPRRGGRSTGWRRVDLKTKKIPLPLDKSTGVC